MFCKLISSSLVIATKVPPCIRRSDFRYISRMSQKLDISKRPRLVEKELEEQFVRGDGPGGQSVQTTNNCVVLKHLPTGFVVKFHGTRSLHKNREEARKLMIAKLDEFFNKEDSVENQRKRLEKIKFSKMQSKNLKLRDLKAKFKEGLDDDKTKNLNLIKEPQ